MTSDQARAMAHLRPLPRCGCGKPATHQLVNGLNSPQGVYCPRCGPPALSRFKAEA